MKETGFNNEHLYRNICMRINVTKLQRKMKTVSIV